MDALNRFERHRFATVFLAMCHARGAAWAASVLRPFGDPALVKLGDIPDSALVAIVSLWGGDAAPARGVLSGSQLRP